MQNPNQGGVYTINDEGQRVLVVPPTMTPAAAEAAKATAEVAKPAQAVAADPKKKR